MTGIKSYKFLIFNTILCTIVLILAIIYSSFVISLSSTPFEFFIKNLNKDKINSYLFSILIIGFFAMGFTLMMQRYHEKEFKENKLMRNIHILFIYIYMFIGILLLTS